MVEVVKELETLRQNLLDMSLRNNLLNYHFSRKRTISIAGRNPEEIYELFVLQEKLMKFKSKIRSRQISKVENGDEREGDTYENNSMLLRTIGKILDSGEKNEPKNSCSEHFLETTDDSENLGRKLFYVFNQSNSIFEEQGYPVLYLSINFLQWSDRKSSIKNSTAPILLIPIELKRIGKGRNFSIQWTGDEILTSITLQAKMKEFGIQIPDFEMPEKATGIEEYFNAVSAAIREKKDWKILHEICLDLFNFKKFVMYKDLDPATWPEGMSPAEHPLIQKIFNPQYPECEVSGFLEKDVDMKLSAKDTYHIMDADSSQIAVIEDVKAGKNLVVEGPPGTGKSQTIANTIAELMAHGKSILFVSEKMAALHVVKSRLDSAGLGELCLDIHSNKTRKKVVLEELEKGMNRIAPVSISSERDIRELEKMKKELNEYALSLEEPAGKLYPSFYTLYGIREKTIAYFEAKGLKMPLYEFQNPENWESEDWAEAKSILEKLSQVLPCLGTPKKNPWYGCEPGLVLPSDILEIGSIISECATSFGYLEAAIKTLNDCSGTSRPHTLEEITTIIDAAKLLERSKSCPEKILHNLEWDSESSRVIAETLIARLRQYRELKIFVDNTFYPSICDLDTSEFEELSRKFLKVIYPSYRKLKTEISSCYVSGGPSQNDRILLDLACLSEYKSCILELESNGAMGERYFPEHWKGLESDPAVLDEYGRWITSFRKNITEGIFTDKIFGLVVNGVDRAALESAIKGVMEAKKSFLRLIEKSGILIGADFGKIFGKDLEAAKLNQLKYSMTIWEAETSSLVFWSQYLGYKKVWMETKAAPMMEDIEAGKIEVCDMIPAFEGNYAENLLHRTFRKRQALSTFIRELHESKINKFIELDKKVLLENRKRITCSVYDETPKLTYGASRASEAGILLNEFNRKRGHMPIRKLMKKAGGLVQKIKPCFMMSPLSIGQYLDPRSTHFDVIIFDEASQVKPEDAVGALLRGKQVVVMGDSKQLPPTDFFDGIFESPERDPEDYAAAGDLESILNVCKRSFPIKTLRWHYRSRHESLIAVSNQEFYSNRLYVYPSPMQKDERLGLKFVHLKDTVYDRGKSGVNRIEARVVAKAVFEHFSKYPNKSLGVGTFNIKQQEAIQEEIETLLKANPGFDLNPGNEREEHFFVKNLETIQGDERDVIILSVGFGFDNSGKLSLNFGPLNREGGERRLNVLITRAREKCVVFANFTSRNLNLDENSSFGLRSLKVFLEFAESGRLTPPTYNNGASESPFEEVIYDFLVENACEVHRQIGCAGYRLDLAIPDPGNPGRYVLGVECDGESYYLYHVARDRDRLRQQVLEGLGWRIYRVWSTDWYLHPKESKEKLLGAVKKAIKQENLQAKLEPEVLTINEPSSWGEQAHNNSIKKLASCPAETFSSIDNMENKADENLGFEFREKKSPSLAISNAVDEEPYSDFSLGLKEGLIDSSKEDFLPEMALRSDSIALLADVNPHKKSTKKFGKSKSLKFNVNLCSEKENSSEIIPEPEPERVSFYQAYPEIYSISATGKKKKNKRLNEFAYIYGSVGHFEPESDSEENNYAGKVWNLESEIETEIVSKAKLGIDSRSQSKPHSRVSLYLKNKNEVKNFGESSLPKGAEKLLGKNEFLEAAVPLYRVCYSSGLPHYVDFFKLSDEKLTEAVIRIIEFEGPIHAEFLMQRIKAHVGISRMFGKIKRRILDSVALAESAGKIRVEGEFFWPSSEPVCLLRRRDGEVSAKIEWICDEEIKKAVSFVLNSQYSTPLEDLIVQASRVLGIKTTHKNTWERIEKLVQSEIENNELTLMPNEMIYFVE
jgi:superfamily I DNA and/or RNA helicase/very-short-patch-repair endonuclease